MCEMWNGMNFFEIWNSALNKIDGARLRTNLV